MRRAYAVALGVVVGAALLPGTVAGVCIACSRRRSPVDVDAVLAHMEQVARWDF